MLENHVPNKLGLIHLLNDITRASHPVAPVPPSRCGRRELFTRHGE